MKSLKVTIRPAGWDSWATRDMLLLAQKLYIYEPVHSSLTKWEQLIIRDVTIPLSREIQAIVRQEVK